MTPSSPPLLFDNKYRLQKELGEGAFAQVYLAEYLPLRQWRALKIFRRDAPGMGSKDFEEYLRRFRHEAELGAQFGKHAHLIQVFDFLRQGSVIAVAMEYAPKGNLALKLREEGALAIPAAVQITTELARGLAALHEHDVVHRDLKPANILFDAQGRAQIADLGLAQSSSNLSQRSVVSQTQYLPHPGTPQYMSPEQASSPAHLAPASDVYALGCVLFEMLTGKVYKNQRPGTQVNSLRPEVPQWLNDLLVRMTAKNIEDRPWNGEETLELLKPPSPKGRGAGGERLPSPPGRGAGGEGKGFTLQLAPGVSMDFVHIPAGEFLMGSDPKVDEQASSDEQPQHKVMLTDYWIGRFPVTVAQYRTFINSSGYQTTDKDSLKGADDHPVRWVYWQDALAYSDWLNKQMQDWARGVSKLETLPTQNGRRALVEGLQRGSLCVTLPSEAEWEKAARGTDGRIYPWGNQTPDETRCNFGGKVGDTTSVGKYSPLGDSPYGCADMSGNVWEWTRTIWAEKFKYPYNSSDGRESLKDKTLARVVRGGSFYSDNSNVRCAVRFWNNFDIRHRGFGFRVVVSPCR